MTNNSQSNNTDGSPEFSPSILHNKRGPLNPHSQSNRFTALMPKGLDVVLKDKRVLAVICLFLPPLAVFLKTGISRKFGLSLLLFAFFIFPGTSCNLQCPKCINLCTVGILYGFYVTFIESSLESSSSVTEV